MEWISVKDRLPDDETPILLKLEKEILKSNMHSGYYKEGKPFIVASVFAFDAPKITHWMPLPEPPKE